ARDDLERHSGGDERLRLLPAAPEHHRISALQADHGLPRAGALDEQAVDLVLLEEARAAPVLPREDALGARRRVAQELGVREVVVDDDVGAPEAVPPAEREAPGVAGTGADE